MPQAKTLWLAALSAKPEPHHCMARSITAFWQAANSRFYFTINQAYSADEHLGSICSPHSAWTAGEDAGFWQIQARRSLRPSLQLTGGHCNASMMQVPPMAAPLPVGTDEDPPYKFTIVISAGQSISALQCEDCIKNLIAWPAKWQ